MHRVALSDVFSSRVPICWGIDVVTTVQAGVFTVSLDFELYWGVRDVLTIEQYRTHLLGVRAVVPNLLRIFAEYGIHATWATVGLLSFETRAALIAGAPACRPHYADPRLSPYESLGEVGADENADPYHFAPSLLRLIAATPHQEIATHTFAHYYCGEPGRDPASFIADLEAANAALGRYGRAPRSIVFPRNQIDPAYLSLCREAGITAYRGNERSSLYAAGYHPGDQPLRRVLRLVDAYVNLTSHNCHPRPTADTLPINIPASRFLRPHRRHLAVLEPLRLRRITAALTHAACTGQVFHLWWHPHNFGADIGGNLRFLARILDHYSQLRQCHRMESLNMGELAALALDTRGHLSP